MRNTQHTADLTCICSTWARSSRITVTDQHFPGRSTKKLRSFRIQNCIFVCFIFSASSTSCSAKALLLSWAILAVARGTWLSILAIYIIPTFRAYHNKRRSNSIRNGLVQRTRISHEHTYKTSSLSGPLTDRANQLWARDLV